MHRPGVCTVRGDVIRLDGVTIEEVERYHLDTLIACLERVNADIAAYERQQAEERERQDRTRANHERSVDEVIDRLDFGH